MISQIIISSYGLITVKSVIIPAVRKFTIKILTFIFLGPPIKVKLFPNILNQRVRKPVRELCSLMKRRGLAKSIAWRVIVVIISSAASTVLSL